jgi:predicted transcriptional regulator
MILKAQEEQMEMYKTQLEYLDQQKDLEMSENEANKKKLDEFLQKELEKNNKLNSEIKKLEERTSQLENTRTELFKQLKTMEKLHNEK